MPETPSVGDYKDCLRAELQAIAGSLDLSYEQLTGDLTGVNYSSIRAGLLELRRRHEEIQHGVICFQLNRPIWKRFVRDAGGTSLHLSAYPGNLPALDFLLATGYDRITTIYLRKPFTPEPDHGQVDLFGRRFRLE